MAPSLVMTPLAVTLWAKAPLTNCNVAPLCTCRLPAVVVAPSTASVPAATSITPVLVIVVRNTAVVAGVALRITPALRIAGCTP